MPHPTLLDLATRSTPRMAEKKSRWIKGATANAHGQFRHKAEAAGESTKEFAQAHKGDSGRTGEQARLALNLMGASGAIKKPGRARSSGFYDRK